MNNTYGNLNTVDEARKRLGGVGVTTLYNWIAAGHVRAIKIGGRRFVTDSEIDRVLDEANQAAAEKANGRRKEAE